MSNTPHISPFEVIRRVSDDGIEYWSARDLYKLLGYSSWQKFQFALDQAKKACENSGQAVSQSILTCKLKWFNWVLEGNERQPPLLDDRATTDEA